MKYEDIINLAAGFVHGRETSATLEQHCSAMRMDNHHSFVSNQIGYALTDARKDVDRVGRGEEIEEKHVPFWKRVEMTEAEAVDHIRQILGTELLPWQVEVVRQLWASS